MDNGHVYSPYDIFWSIIRMMKSLRRILMVFLATQLMAIGAYAEGGGEEWRPPVDGFDWVQLNNKEWLMGQIKSMYSNSLEFESDTLDTLKLDWDDVTYLRSANKANINIEDIGSVEGLLVIDGDIVKILHGDDLKEFSRSRLISLTTAGEREVDLWATDLTLGLNLRSGNTEQVDYTARFAARRRTANSRVTIDYVGNISKTDGGTGELVETVNNNRIIAAWSVYETRNFFYTPIFGEYYRDPFQNIDGRYTVGVGFGYTIIDDGKVEWSVGAGPAYLQINYLSVQPGEDDSISSGALALSSDYTNEINSQLDLAMNYSATGSHSDTGGYTHNFRISLATELTESLDFDLSFTWDHTSEPKTNADGITPQPDDFRFMFGLGWSL